nr:MAG TPA: hypothetical protein [Caudoviricetes sp.]
MFLGNSFGQREDGSFILSIEIGRRCTDFLSLFAINSLFDFSVCLLLMGRSVMAV